MMWWLNVIVFRCLLRLMTLTSNMYFFSWPSDDVSWLRCKDLCILHTPYRLRHTITGSSWILWYPFFKWMGEAMMLRVVSKRLPKMQLYTFCTKTLGTVDLRSSIFSFLEYDHKFYKVMLSSYNSIKILLVRTHIRWNLFFLQSRIFKELVVHNITRASLVDEDS